MIPANFNIRGDIINERRPSPAKHDVFSCRLELIVHYLERTWTIPTEDSLRVLTYNVDVGDIRVNRSRSVGDHV